MNGRSIESPESSSPIVTRAVSAGLRNEFCDNYVFPPWQKWLLNALGVLPQDAATFIISRFQSLSGLPPEVLDDFQIGDLIAARLNDYTQSSKIYPAIVMGGAMGGATTYLSLAIGGPFLPQAFVVTLKGGSKDGDVYEYLQRSLSSALNIASSNPELLTIQHYDPVHDGWLTRYVNHLRFKLLDLPKEYIEFIRSRLKPGGTIIFLEGNATWLQYRVGPRSVFQVGGWGGISPQEFLEGSPRLENYARRTGLKYAGWKLDDYPLEKRPESEWGNEPGLAEAVEDFCKKEGFRYIRISLPHPNDFSKLAFSAALRLLQKENRQPAGTLIEMFSQFDSTAAFQSGLLPLWLIFNTEDSLEYLREMSRQFPRERPVFFSPLSTFSITPDLVPFNQWETALKEFTWTNIGARRNHYPADARALVKWTKRLRQWVGVNYNPIHSILDGDEIFDLAATIIREQSAAELPVSADDR